MATAVQLAPSTPPDYHRIVSPTLKIPSDTSFAIPVGILACQRDPLLRSLNTVVVCCTISQIASASSIKKLGKKAVIAPLIPTDPMLEVILHDTVIFPEGGGQPTDTGTITTPGNLIWEVVQAKRHGGHAVHYVRVKNGDVTAALLAFSPRTQVIVSLGQEGYDRRYDHMSMHTSQHLLSALLETRLGLPTLSWSLTSYPSPCYVEIPRGMTQAEIANIQVEANRLVFEGRRIFVEVEELDKEKEQDVPKLETGRAIGKALPDDYTGGIKRVVVIDGVDKNPCCGTHLPSIHNLQLFLLPHTEALSRSSTTSARLYFFAGPRLVAYLTETHTLLANTSSVLSCGAPLVPERITQVIDERKKAEKRANEMEIELATAISRQLIKGISKGKSTGHLHRVDDGNALGFLSAIAFALTDTAVKEKLDIPYLFVFSSSPSVQTSSSMSTVLVAGSDDKRVKEAGEGLKTKLGIKGGGKGARWSGKFNGVWKDSRESVVVDDIVGRL